MEIGNNQLLEFLLEFDRFLTRKIEVVAVGGTALTLLGKKASTRDIDFCFINENDRGLFKRTAKKLGYGISSPARIIGHGIAIDHYSSGYIFCVQLPNDYKVKAKKISEMQKITLYALAPLDLLITKASRFNDRDKEDLRVIVHNYDIDQTELVDRWIETMKNSLVRDSKEHLLLLLELFKKEKQIDQFALKKAGEWSNE